MASKKTFGIDDYINKDLKKLGKEAAANEKKDPEYKMLRYMVSPREFTLSFSENKPNRIVPIDEFKLDNDQYNIVYVLINNDKEVWRLYTSTESKETVDILRSDKPGIIENICTHTSVGHIKSDNEKIKELIAFKKSYKKVIKYYHLELNFDQGIRKFLGRDLF